MLISYNPDLHLFFDEMVIFLTSAAALQRMAGVQGRGKAAPYKPDDRIIFEGTPSLTNVEIRFAPHPVLEALVKGEWPSLIEIEKEDLPPRPKRKKTHTRPGLPENVLHRLARQAFVSYFEKALRESESVFPPEVNFWPDMWRFGKVVRDALLDECRIRFTGKEPVRWKGLNFFPEDEGRLLELKPADIFCLMEDLNTSHMFFHSLNG